MIAVDQDSLGVQGTRIHMGKDGSQVWFRYTEISMNFLSKKRPLSNGDRAVVLLSTNATSPIEIQVHWKEINLPQVVYSVRDLWLHQDLGMYTKSGNTEKVGRFTHTFSTKVDPHSVVMIRVSDL